MVSLIVFCFSVLASPALGSHSDQEIYSRTIGTYTIQSGGNCWHVAYKLYNDKSDAFYNEVAREIALLNKIKKPYDSMGPGTKLKYPKYKKSKRKFCGDIRNWKYAVEAGHLYSVCPALLIGIRTHENPSSDRDHFAYGVIRCKYSDLETQAFAAARALSRYKVKWNPENPTKSQLVKVGSIYCPTGPSHWANQVYTIRKWALGG